MHQPPQQTWLKMPRRLLLRWLGIYFVLFSLSLLVMVAVLLGSSSGGPLSALGSAALAIVFLAALINLVLGSLSVLLSFWRRSGGRSVALQPERWPRNRTWRFVYQATLGFIGAVILYGLIGVGGILAIGFVVENALGWWYGWRMPQVKLGDSQQRVEQLVGRGSFRTECDSAYARDYSRATDLNRCASLVLYYQNNGGRWELGYNAENQVVSKQYVKH